MCSTATSGSTLTSSLAVTESVRFVESILICAWPASWANPAPDKAKKRKAAPCIRRLPIRSPSLKERATGDFLHAGLVARLILALATGPKRTQCGQRSRGLPGVDRLGPDSYSFLQIAGQSAGHQRRRRIQQNNVASRPRDSREYVVEQCRIGSHIATGEIFQL